METVIASALKKSIDYVKNLRDKKDENDVFKTLLDTDIELYERILDFVSEHNQTAVLNMLANMEADTRHYFLFYLKKFVPLEDWHHVENYLDIKLAKQW